MLERDDVERLLDSALLTYGDPEPGLEDRILRSLKSGHSLASADRSARTMRRWLPWAIAVPLAAALAFFYLMIPRNPAAPVDHAQSAPQSQAPLLTTVPLVTSTFRHALSPSAVHPSHSRRTSLPQMAGARTFPKQNVFPSLQPLSREEQALVAIAHAPESVRQSLIDAKTPDAPITISAVQIEPVTMPDAGHN